MNFDMSIYMCVRVRMCERIIILHINIWLIYMNFPSTIICCEHTQTRYVWGETQVKNSIRIMYELSYILLLIENVFFLKIKLRYG